VSLLAGAVSEEAVEALRGKEKPKAAPSGETILKRLDALLVDAGSLAPRERLVRGGCGRWGTEDWGR
jgi:hypothetical protein